MGGSGVPCEARLDVEITRGAALALRSTLQYISLVTGRLVPSIEGGED